MDNSNSQTEKESLPLPIEFCKIFAIREILNGSPELSTIFFSYLSPEESLNIIQSLFVSDPPTSFKTSENIPTTQHYRWLLSCFISYFISKIPNRKKFILPNYYFNVQKRIQLSMYKSSTTDSIIKLLARMSNETQMKLAKLLLNLHKENRPLFEWIIEYREVNKYFKNFQLSSLFEKFNFQCFQLYRVELDEGNKDNDSKSQHSYFDESELNGISFNFKEKKEIETFFSIPSVLFDEKPIISFQNSYIQDHSYPCRNSFFEYDEETSKLFESLLHSSISLKKFFVDIIKDDISKTLIKNDEELSKIQDPSNIRNVKNDDYKDVIKNNQDRLNEAVNNSSILNEMQSWTFLSLFPDILNKYEQYYEQIEALTFVCDSIPSQLFERLKNDRILFNEIHDWTGKFVSSNDFLEKSMPSEILDFIKNLDANTVYKEIENKKLLCLSDEDKIKDCDFLYGYLALSNQIKIILEPQEFDKIEPIAEEIGFCIERILSDEKKNSIITDLFSLLFLNKNNEYLFHTLSMQIISQILLNNANDKMVPYINDCLVQIQLFEQSSKNKNSPFSNLFISSKNKLLFALANSNIVFAENLAKTTPENQKLFNSYTTVKNCMKQSRSKPESQINSNIDLNDENGSNSSFIDINKKSLNEIEEVALSVEGQSYLFDRIKKEETKIDEVKELASTQNYKKPFKIVKTFSKKKFAFLKEKLEQKNETKWKVPTFLIESEKEESNNQQIIYNNSNKLNNIKLLKGFFEYLDLLIPTLLSPGQTIESVLNKNVDEILDEFLSKEEFEKAEKLSETMRVDIQKKVLSSLKYQPKCYEHYSDGLKPVLSTISLLGNWKDYFQKLNLNEENQKVILKLLDEKNPNLRKFILNQKDELIPPDSDNIYDEIEFNDNFKQEGFQVTEKMLSETINTNNDLFIDLCFRSTTQQIENVFNNHLNDETIDDLFELMKLCPVSFEFRRKCQLLYDLRHKYSYKISNINQSFIDLLSDMKYFDAMRFYQCFPEIKDEFDNYVRQALQNSADESNKIDIGIVMVAPHMRNEIIDFFKKLKVQEEEEMFQDLIPNNWVYMNDFKDTIDTNINNDPNGAIQVLTKLELLDCDQIIIEYLNQSIIQNDNYSSIDKINFLRHECNRFITVIRNTSLLSNFIYSNLIDLLYSITVDSKDIEYNLSFYLQRMLIFLNSKWFSSKNIDKKIIAIYHFCSQFFFIKYNFVYNLNEIDKMIGISADKGLYSITKDLADSYDIEITEKSFEIYLKQFRLYFFNTKPVLPFSLKGNKLEEKTRIELQRKCSEKFAYYASKQSEFNGSLIRNLELNVEKNNLNEFLNKSISFFNKHNDVVQFAFTDQQNEVFDFFSNQADIETASKFYVTDIEKGFLLLESLNKEVKNENERENQIKIGFVDLFVSSLSFSKLNIFMKMFRQFDPNHTKYAHFLKGMYDSCDSSSFPFLKFSLSQIMGDYLTTAKSALKVYTIKPELAYLDIAEFSLAELSNNLTKKMNSKSANSKSDNSNSNSKSDNSNSNSKSDNSNSNSKSGISNSNSKTESSNSNKTNSFNSEIDIENLNVESIQLLLENIKRTLHKISLQRQFIVFCIENRISDFETLNLFHGNAAIDSIITLLFKNSEFQLSTEILRSLNQTEKSLTNEFQIEPIQSKNYETNWFNINKSYEYETSLSRAAFSLANDGFNAVIKFAQTLQQNLKNEKEFETIIYAFINQFKLAPFNEIEWIKIMALNVVKNIEFKVKILIEIDEFDIAADIAVENRNKVDHLIPLIAHLSYSKSNLNAYYKCQKALEYSG